MLVPSDAPDPLVKAGQRAWGAHEQSGIEVRDIHSKFERACAHRAAERTRAQARLNQIPVPFFVTCSKCQHVQAFYWPVSEVCLYLPTFLIIVLAAAAHSNDWGALLWSRMSARMGSVQFTDRMKHPT
jgi:hypothetical protein